MAILHPMAKGTDKDFMIRKKKTAEEEKVLELPDEYILIAADLSLNRPGFCRMHIKHL